MSRSPERSAEVERRKDQIYVGQLSERVRESELREKFGKFGEIKEFVMKIGYAFIVICRENLDIQQR